MRIDMNREVSLWQTPIGVDTQLNKDNNLFKCIDKKNGGQTPQKQTEKKTLEKIGN